MQIIPKPDIAILILHKGIFWLLQKSYIFLITKSSDKHNEQIKQSPENKDNNKPQF